MSKGLYICPTSYQNKCSSMPCIHRTYHKYNKIYCDFNGKNCKKCVEIIDIDFIKKEEMEI